MRVIAVLSHIYLKTPLDCARKPVRYGTRLNQKDQTHIKKPEF